MRIEPIGIAGAAIIEIDPLADERGFFARVFCARGFEGHGLPLRFVQSSLSYNRRRGALRGMHFQRAPSREDKLVRCVRGAIHDVLLDLRPDSPAFGTHVAVELTADNRRAVLVPAGVAHGFQALADDTELLYMMTDFYAPELSDGVRWNDPAFGIAWPIAPAILHPRDAAYPDFDPTRWRRSG